MSIMRQQKGAVSLFVVIFAMLLITVSTLSFLRVMMREQQQASNNDLSQSAYDSATSGVEDVKRALIRYRAFCTANAANCDAARAVMSSNLCNVGVKFDGSLTVPASPNPEELIRQTLSTTDASLQQAYTCTKVTMETADYVGTLKPNESKLVPLVGTRPFSSITVRWFSDKDTSADGAVSSPGAANQAGRFLPSNTTATPEWSVKTPPLLRTQFMQVGSSFTMSDFDKTDGDKSNGNTAFLYPTVGLASAKTSIYLKTVGDNGGEDFRATSDPLLPASSNGPTPIKCNNSVAGGGYACEVTINLPEPMNGSMNDRTAFLRLTPFYNATHFQVVLGDGITVKFQDIQPAVDSTGRANDLYRRVLSRVDLYDTEFPYPDASVDISSGNFCKDFSVTDNSYIAGSCRP